MTSEQLLALGVKGELFGRLLRETKHLSDEEAEKLVIKLKAESNNKERKKNKWAVEDGSILQWFLENPHIRPHSKEPGNSGPASNSEIKRWLEQGSVRLNGLFPKPDWVFPAKVDDLVFFPGSKSQTTFM